MFITFFLRHVQINKYLFKTFLNAHISPKISVNTSGPYITPSENTDQKKAD